jgi:exosortase
LLRQEPLRSVALAALTGLVVGVSPFMPQEWTVKLGGGLLAAGAVLAWRLWWSPPEAPAEAGPTFGVPARDVPVSVWITLGLVGAFFVPTAVFFYERWTGNIWENGHGIFMPFLMFFLARAALRNDPHPERPESSPLGLLLAVPALLLAVADFAIRTNYLGAVSFVLMLPGLSLLLLGVRRTRMLAMPLLLGVFMIPIPNFMGTHLFLKTWTARMVEPMIRTVGIPVLREDTVLLLPNETFVVADACSGFSTLYAAVGLSLILARYSRSNLRRVALLLAAWPLALLCNTLRVFLLVVAANSFGTELLDTFFHGASGVATFWLVLLALFSLADRERLRTAFA